eukprot:TRINITY_DN16691_c0_g1_i6.p1 TRINITY_DN16691_c0_g1~~TRINITY_DN16691_c0_g1_i6.p1  ORF type:complete len:422 (-),score=97.28 TRINITY_DN16691_c0_g1_i6:192-1457(-)
MLGSLGGWEMFIRDRAGDVGGREGTFEVYYLGDSTTRTTCISTRLQQSLLSLVSALEEVCPEAALDARLVLADGARTRDDDMLADALQKLSSQAQTHLSEGASTVSSAVAERDELQAKFSAESILSTNLDKECQGLRAQVKSLGDHLQEVVEVQRQLEESLDRETKYRIMVETLEKEAGLELERNAKMKTDYARLHKELQNERRGLPSELEMVVSQKDAMIGHLQQELSKWRTNARSSVDREVSLERTVQELQGELQFQTDAQAFRVRQQALQITENGASPKAASPRVVKRDAVSAGAPRLLSSSPQTQRQRNSLALSPAARGGQSAASQPRSSQQPYRFTDAMFEPEEESPVAGVLTTSESPKRVNRGNCPHCVTPLTPFEGTRFGTRPEDSEKVAFCFSCRRAFTGRDLKGRDASLKRQ